MIAVAIVNGIAHLTWGVDAIHLSDAPAARALELLTAGIGSAPTKTAGDNGAKDAILMRLERMLVGRGDAKEEIERYLQRRAVLRSKRSFIFVIGLSDPNWDHSFRQEIAQIASFCQELILFRSEIGMENSLWWFISILQCASCGGFRRSCPGSAALCPERCQSVAPVFDVNL